MPSDPIVTREISELPKRREDAHKGNVGRLVIIGGCCDDTLMVGAVALTANAAFRSGIGLTEMLVPESLRIPSALLAPCATTRALPTDVDGLLRAVEDFNATVVALGPGLGHTLAPELVAEFLSRFTGPVVVDADGLNRLSEGPPTELPEPRRIVMTPHPGELRRLLASRGMDCPIDATAASRRQAACTLAEVFGCTAVFKGNGTVVTDGERLYVNETGNAGMATGGAGDVLTGVIAALIGQQMDVLEAAILGVYLHGLAGDFAAEELGRWSLTATDLVQFLSEAFCEHQTTLPE